MIFFLLDSVKLLFWQGQLVLWKSVYEQAMVWELCFDLCMLTWASNNLNVLENTMASIFLASKNDSYGPLPAYFSSV